MTIRHTFCALTAAVAVLYAAPASSQGYKAVNQLTVVPLNPTSFEVIEAYGEGARGIWCAAADFAIHRLGHARNQRLYVKTPRGRSVTSAGRIGVEFTTDASSLGVAPTASYSVSVRQPGQGLPTHHAYQFCRDYFIDLNDILLRPGRW